MLLLFGALPSLLLALLLCTVPFDASGQNRAIPIVPGLHGFGTHTVAGSGRNLRPPRSTIFVVSSLSSSGPKTLKECVDGRTPRTCVFTVGGEIRLPRALKISSPFITIAGQTAPPPRITLTGSGIVVATHDVLIQHLAIRPGDGRYGHPPGERDGISIGAPPPKSAYNVVIDHVSITWAVDENVSTAYPSTHEVTIANSLIAEGLHRSIHPKGPHSKGVMVGDGSKQISILRNLIAFNEERNPYLKPGSSTEFINNVVYGWGSKGGWSLCNTSIYDETGAPIVLSFIGNTYKPSPSSVRLWPIYGKRIHPLSTIFERDTVAPVSYERASETNYTRSEGPPLTSTPMGPLDANEAYRKVLAQAGSRPARRSPIDRRIVAEVARGTGDLKDCVTGCARPTGALQGTMMAQRKIRLPRYPFRDSNDDGYTDLENWLHRRAQRLEHSP